MSSENDSANQEPLPSRGSPVSGCIILSSILIVFGGLIVLYLVVGSLQNRKYDDFTEPTAVQLSTIEPTAAQREEALGKLRQIEEAVAANREDRVVFTATDLNVLIATLDVLADFRGQTWIESIQAQGIAARMAQELRSPLFSKRKRFLNATITFEPQLRARTLAFIVRNIRPDKGEVEAQFISNFAALDFFKLDPEIEALKTHIKAIDHVYTDKDALVVVLKEVDQLPAGN